MKSMIAVRVRHLYPLLLVGIFLLDSCNSNNSLPSDAFPSCTFSPADFAALFQSGAVSKDGVVKPAIGFSFGGPIDGNCRFYQWAEQMFLWVTSPAPATYGGGGRVFESGVFFDVTPPDASGQRTLIKHNNGLVMTMRLRDAQVGLHGLPTVNTRDGRIFEVFEAPLSKNGLQRILNAGGDTIEISHATVDTKGSPVLSDSAGRIIEGAKPIIPPQFRGQEVVQVLKLDNLRQLFITRSGAVIEVEQGQADNAILESQGGSLVYYSVMVNDVYAYYLTGIKDGGIVQVPANFPTTGSELKKITDFARAHGVPTLPDSNALAVELKASWVEASTLSDPDSYIRMEGIVPVYDKSDPNKWKPSGTKQTTLALVGIHVVGSIQNHPEMIWSTFEHYENTPNAAYAYVNNSGVTVNVERNTAGHYLFCADGAPAPYNVQHMDLVSGNIIPHNASVSISPSNTIRWKAWGNASDQFPNQEDTSISSANTKIISINNSVHTQLAAGDVRANYNFMGATWTFDGSPGNAFNGAGTSRLCNTTMETYIQGTNTRFATGGTCFTCHSNIGTGSSHIFDATKKLF